MRDIILDAAERRIRSVGFNAVSFRDIAEDVGIRSASIHYHFPKKEDLGIGLVERYCERFQAGLDAIDTTDPAAAMSAFVDLYGDALTVGEEICLCAMLGAETNGLPVSVKHRVRRFFDLNINWLKAFQARHDLAGRRFSPTEIVAMLEGAMIVATVMDSRAPFDAVARQIRSNVA